MESDRKRDERVMQIVSAALLLDAKEREPHIRIACGPDRELYNEVAEILDWEQRMGNFLQQPLGQMDQFVHPFKAGDIVSDRFEIVREIGEGAMGLVYEGFDRKRRQRIAIKAAKLGFHRFLSPELENALKVRHPNVCLVNEIHTASTKCGDIDFLTMELLEGETLSACLSNSSNFSANEVTEIARQLCDGLAEAHRIGVIHGDLKSGNVILCRATNGAFRAVITDFGISGEAAQSGRICGTPRYIAPELWLDKKASKASDIYALGVILFEMAAGHPASTDLPSSLRIYPSGLPKSYSRLVEGCLSLDPRRRCQAFETALQHNYWEEPLWTRRKMLVTGVSVASAALSAAWLERTKLGNLLHPLPTKRFVALLPWPPISDAHVKPFVNGVIDAIESELSRAESSDRNFFVISSDGPSTSDPSLAHVCETLGANLALEASAVPHASRFQLFLKLSDAATNSVLRHAKVECAMEEISLLAYKAVQTSATLLDVRLPRSRSDALKAGTNSALAFRDLQVAEEFLKRPNDDGLEKAIENYKAAIETDPNYATAHAKLAVAYSRLYALNRDPGTLELVEANAEKAIRLDPALADAYLALSAVWEERGDEEKALREIRRALALDPSNPRSLQWEGELYARFNRWTEAQQSYIRLRNERPNYWAAYNDLGYVLTEQGKYREAIEAFQAATVLAPGSALAFSNLGELFLKLGNIAEARDSFEMSLKRKPTDMAYCNLSEAMRAEGKYAEAVSLSQQAVKLNPLDDQNWLELADCYDSTAGRQTEAHDAYRRAAAEAERHLQTDPTDAPAWIRLSLYQAKTGSLRDATASLKKGAQLGPSDLDSELTEARVLELLGKRADALATLAYCFKRGTTPFEVSSIRDLASLQKDPEYLKTMQLNTRTNRKL